EFDMSGLLVIIVNPSKNIIKTSKIDFAKAFNNTSINYFKHIINTKLKNRVKNIIEFRYN
ncbi:MAG TPA: hypothetical protein VMT35_19505, partial [Ignavibacteriaceae bacterium]|nr:hypothetical protein [Ignavibacteriaceae bacterium]